MADTIDGELSRIQQLVTDYLEQHEKGPHDARAER